MLLGLGNDLLSDDAVGLLVVRQIRSHLADSKAVEVLETSEMGLALLDYIVGFDDLFLVDAVQTGREAPGFLHEFDGAKLEPQPLVAPHLLGVGEVLALGRELGLAVPDRVRILAIEVENAFTVGTQLTFALRQALPGLVQQVLQKLNGVMTPAAVG